MIDIVRQFGLLHDISFMIKLDIQVGRWSIYDNVHLVNGELNVSMVFLGKSRIDGLPVFRVYILNIEDFSLQWFLDKPDTWITQTGITPKLYTNRALASLITPI